MKNTALHVVPKTKTRTARKPKMASSMGVVDQLRFAAQKGNRLALGIGLAIGAFPPVLSWHVSHVALDMSSIGMSATGLHQLGLLFLVLGCLVFSAKSVYQWGLQAFECRIKAVGFAIALEAALILVPTVWVSRAALSYLVGVNAIANGAALALKQRRG